MRVLVCGSRSFRDASFLSSVLSSFSDVSSVVVGDARGADRVVVSVARGLGLPVSVFRADWSRFGRSAGPRRNAAMVAAGVDLVLAFFGSGVSRGTCDCVRKGLAAGVPVRVFRSTSISSFCSFAAGAVPPRSSWSPVLSSAGGSQLSMF